MIFLDIKNIRLHYDKAEVLKGVSIRADKGEIITLVGANGAGKTSILKTISGVVAPSSGEIWFESRRIDGMPSYAISRLGIIHVPEGRRVFATMTVRENLEMGAYLQKDRRIVYEDLNNIYIKFPVLNKRHEQAAGSLSGGEQQMLAIGRALMGRPRLMLMDEPSSGLSPLVVNEISVIISNINQAGVTIVLVEQNAQMALKIANRAYVLEVGKIALEGSAREIAGNEHIRKAYLGG